MPTESHPRHRGAITRRHATRKVFLKIDAGKHLVTWADGCSHISSDLFAKAIRSPSVGLPPELYHGSHRTQTCGGYFAARGKKLPLKPGTGMCSCRMNAVCLGSVLAQQIGDC
jgi:hypothetical protein